MILMTMYYSAMIDKYVFATMASSGKMAAFAKNNNITINYGDMRTYKNLTYIHANAIPLDRELYEDVYQEIFDKHKYVFQYYFKDPENPEYQLFYADI